MVGQHHQLNGHEFEQTLGDDGEQRSPVCCNPQGCKALDTATEQLSNTGHFLSLWKTPDAHKAARAVSR